MDRELKEEGQQGKPIWELSEHLNRAGSRKDAGLQGRLETVGGLS